MAKQHLEILCPDCKSRLEVDLATGEVSSHGKEKKVENLADAAAKVEKRKTKHEDAFASGLNAEKRRSEELNDLFKQATEQVEDDDEKPDNPMEDKWR